MSCWDTRWTNLLAASLSEEFVMNINTPSYIHYTTNIGNLKIQNVYIMALYKDIINKC